MALGILGRSVQTLGMRLILLLFAVLPSLADAQIYKYVGADGIVNYTNVRPRVQADIKVETIRVLAHCVACDPQSTVDWTKVPLRRGQFEQEIRWASRLYRVDEALLRAVIHAESAYDRWAVSVKGARGLMQLMPPTQAELGIVNPYNAREAIAGGARYLRQLLDRFNGDARLATAAYNAGPGAVSRYGGVPPFAETQVFVTRVAALRDRYAEPNSGVAKVEPDATTASSISAFAQPLEPE